MLNTKFKFIFIALIVQFNLDYSNAQVALYSQCGGIGYTGSTTCASGTKCFVQHQYYSQCLTSCPSGWQCSGNIIFLIKL